MYIIAFPCFRGNSSLNALLTGNRFSSPLHMGFQMPNGHHKIEERWEKNSWQKSLMCRYSWMVFCRADRVSTSCWHTNSEYRRPQNKGVVCRLASLRPCVRVRDFPEKILHVHTVTTGRFMRDVTIFSSIRSLILLTAQASCVPLKAVFFRRTIRWAWIEQYFPWSRRDRGKHDIFQRVLPL